MSKEWIELKINSDKDLCICADLANSLKHGGLDRKPRSGESPKLAALKYQMPQKAIESILVGANFQHVVVSHPELVKLEMPVLGDSGQLLGDAFKFLEHALSTWENIVKEVDNAV